MFVPHDPFEAYKYGVEKATKPFDGYQQQTLPLSQFNQILDERRKTLLTRKMTKWIIAMPGKSGYEEYIHQGRFYDSREAAEKFSLQHLGSAILGVFPVEIELPL
jgi:hypothetical protein